MEDFTLPSGEVVQVRGLTGFEFMLGRKRHPGDELGIGAAFLGFVWGISEDAAVEWMKSHSAGDLSAVNQRINELSGLIEGAPKSGVDRDGGRRDD